MVRPKMSAKGRGPSLGGPEEWFPTPAYCVHQLFEAQPALAAPRHGGRGKETWLDPCAGDGVLVREATKFVIADWITYDVLPKHILKPSFGSADVTATFCYDVLKHGIPHTRYHTTLMNPPFSYWTEFVELAMRVSQRVIVLGNMTIQGSLVRNAWWQHMSKYLVGEHVLVPRPRFRKKSSDAVDYCWFVFDKEPRPFTKTWPKV